VADIRVPYRAYSPPDPATGEFNHLLSYGAGEVDVIEDADPQTVLAVVEAAVNKLGHAEPGKQVRIELDIGGRPWSHTYDAPEV
jgi:hypothetical protein